MSGGIGRHIFSTFKATAGSEQIISISCFYGTCHKYNTMASVPQSYILREPTQKTAKSCGLLKTCSRIRVRDSSVSETGVDAFLSHPFLSAEPVWHSYLFGKIELQLSEFLMVNEFFLSDDEYSLKCTYSWWGLNFITFPYRSIWISVREPTPR